MFKVEGWHQRFIVNQVVSKSLRILNASASFICVFFYDVINVIDLSDCKDMVL